MSEEQTQTTEAQPGELGNAKIFSQPTGSPPAYIGDEPVNIGDTVSIKGVAGEKVPQPAAPAQPVAAPIQQIAPVSSNGEQTSARETPKADAPANNEQSTPAADGPTVSSKLSPPQAAPALSSEQPAVPEAPVEEQPEVEEELVVDQYGQPLRSQELQTEGVDPLAQAAKFLSTVPSKMRLF